MTTDEKIVSKGEVLDECAALIRHTVRHNGAALSARAGLGEVTAHLTETSAARVQTLVRDINTIDHVKELLRRERFWARRPEMTTEELLSYEVNDPRLTADGRSWAVVRITHEGVEILTYGGSYYQLYRRDTYVPHAEGEDVPPLQQVGDTERLRRILEREDAAWMPGEPLRLVGESFGDEYIVSTQDFEINERGTWYE